MFRRSHLRRSLRFFATHLVASARSLNGHHSWRASVLNLIGGAWTALGSFLALRNRVVLKDPAITPFDQVRWLGAIIATTRPNGRHVGFLYQLEGEAPRAVHLAWHYRLTDEPAPPGYHWVQCGLHDLAGHIVAAALAEIAHDQQLPYSTTYNGIYFDPSLRYTRDEPGEGLTCSTFIIAVLETLGLSIVVPEDWPVRDDDETAHEELLGALRSTDNVSPEHIQAIEAQPRGVRFRPEEVAAAVSEEQWPVAFPRAELLGFRIVEQLPA